MNILNRFGIYAGRTDPVVIDFESDDAAKITRISEKLIDLQKLALSKPNEKFPFESINLQLDTRHARISSSGQETQDGKVEGLTDNDLDTVKHILGVSNSGDYQFCEDPDGDTCEYQIYSTKIPTVNYIIMEAHRVLGDYISVDLEFKLITPEKNITDSELEK